MAKKDQTSKKPTEAPPPEAAPPTPAPSAPKMAEEALAKAQEAVASLEQTAASPGGAPAAETPDPAPFEHPAFQRGAAASAPESIELLADVNLNVKIELGRATMAVEDVLRLQEGAVVELDKLAGDPVDVYVNERPVARGEVLVLNDNFCVRINEIIPGPGDGEAAAGEPERRAG